MKISITCITPVLQAILDFFPDIISFQHVFHLGVGRNQMEWKFKVKTQILVFPWAKIGQNDHSNPYIESTTVLSDIYYTYANVSIRKFALFTLVHYISFNFLIQILAPRQMARLGDQQMKFCMHSCTFTRDSITTFTLHITCIYCTSWSGHSWQQSHNIGLVSWVQRCHPFSFGHYICIKRLVHHEVLSLVLFMQSLYTLYNL